MAFDFQGRTLRTIGVIGSGQIGPDIALYFSKVLSRDGVEVVVVDVVEEALRKGRDKLDKKVEKGVESGAFTPDWGAAIKKSVRFTTDYAALAGAQLVVEAATENLELKAKIFADLEKRCANDTIFASNSSHLEPERIFAGLSAKQRSLVIHYFFPAERNPMVEIVPSAATDPALVRWLLDFYEVIGKVPIQVKSRYGYAIDPIFEGLFLASALLVEAGVATSKQVDTVATRTLGLTVGPFTAMNLTGGNPITNVGLDNYKSRIGPWFRAPTILKEAVAAKRAWEVPGRGETVVVDDAVGRPVGDALRGAYFGVCAEIVDSGLASLDDLDMAVEIALDIKAPFRAMNELGTREALLLVEAYAKANPGFQVPAILKQHGESNRPFRIRSLTRRDADGVAILTIRRPKVLNALNQAVFDELRQTFDELGKDPAVRAVVLTGFGTKAFVSGADVHFLARIETPQQGEATSLDSQDALDRIEAFPKPVVCAYNGLAMGGGNELAMACHARIARADLDVLAAQPEVNLGIIPGAGATQRLPRLVGFDEAARLLRTGKPISAQRARDIGLVHELVPGDIVALRQRAVELARELADGRRTLPRLATGPLPTAPAALPALELGHLSRAVDRLLCEAMLEGARLPLREGLRLEAKKFGAVCGLRDMRIGVESFLKNGPRAKAAFVHA